MQLSKPHPNASSFDVSDVTAQFRGKQIFVFIIRLNKKSSSKHGTFFQDNGKFRRDYYRNFRDTNCWEKGHVIILYNVS